MSLFDTLIIQPIFNLLLGLYSIVPGGDFGIAIIVFTIIVRFALWPLLKKQLHQTTAMQKMQPELVKIKKEANGNKQVEGVMMMELYKKHGVSPFSSIGILFIQLPIFIALYRVIQIFTINQVDLAKYTYGFMKGIEPIAKLIADPTSLNQRLFGFIDLTGKAIYQNSNGATAVNIILLVLALAAVVTQYLLTKQTTPKKQTKRRVRDIMAEAANGKEVDQSEITNAMMGNMTKFMPIMFLPVMLYLPGALTLYYMVSNIVAVIQQRSILKKDNDELIEIADEAPVASKQTGKKATAKARAKEAQEGTVIRITAKDTASKKSKK